MPLDKSAQTKIVLVEDDTFLAGMYITKLTMEHFDVRLATDGKQGLKLIQDEQPDLVLLDIILPKLSGFDILKEVRQDPRFKNLPILLLTNLGAREDVERGLALGATDYLIKAHFLPTEVVGKIKRLVG
ncbi:MAG: response regulator [Candidatus Kerfeldbacteria bacterium]|nr:response regulator [Candidatus Kerfeldbacteria bacterium]